MKPRKRYRMSGPVVLIGYLFLIPSIFGMLIGIFTMFSTGTVAEEMARENESTYARQLEHAGFTAEQITAARENLIDVDTLTDEQYSAYNKASLELSGASLGTNAGTAIGGLMGFGMVVFFFCGGLIGYLLIMRKKVLQCTTCDAVIAAS
jgi:hypothetical protein